jgi:ACS family D-galactonate transporter-like MFS transporter
MDTLLSHEEISTGADHVPRRRWWIAVLLGLGVLVNYLDRVNISVSRDALRDAFGISTVMFGYLLSAYSWTYAALQLPSGLLLDRFGVKWVGRVGTLIWSIASFGTAIAIGPISLFSSRFLLGIGEAPIFPANSKATGYWFPRQERSLATAIFDSMAKFAPAIGVPIVGLFLIRFGWRWSFGASGIISFLYFLLFYALYKNPSEDKKLTEAERGYITRGGAQPEDRAKAAKGAPFGYLVMQKKVWGLSLGFASYNYTFYLLLTWLPTYLADQMHVDLLHSVMYTSVPWMVGTFTDLIFGGWLVDGLIQRRWNASRVRQVVLVGGTVLGIGILGTAHAQTPGVALFWMSVSMGGLAAAAPVGWSIPSLIAPRESVGTLGGILNFCNQASAIGAPIATGYIVHATHSYFWAFAAAGVFLIIGVAGYVFLLGAIETIPEPENA